MSDLPDETPPAAAASPIDAASQATQRRNPLHGVTLEGMLTELVAHYGWEELGSRILINSFNTDPSIKSSLKFLRKTPWAREKVEGLYLFMLRERARMGRGQGPV